MFNENVFKLQNISQNNIFFMYFRSNKYSLDEQKETSLKNIKNLTDPKLLTGCVCVYIYIIHFFQVWKNNYWISIFLSVCLYIYVCVFVCLCVSQKGHEND